MAGDVDARIFAFRRNIVVAASAGTGKTYRLSRLYALLCLGLTSMGEETDTVAHAPVAPDRIIATTFSRSAALEMRQRIEALLESVAIDPAVFAEEPSIASRLALVANRPSHDELRERAIAARAALTRAKIDTFHGLAGQIVFEHAPRLGLSPDVRVASDAENEELSVRAVEGALDAALSGDDQAVARDLVRVAGSVGRLRDVLVRFFGELDESGITAAELLLPDHRGEAARLTLELRRIVEGCALSPAPKMRDAAAAMSRSLRSDTPIDPRLLLDLFKVTRTRELTSAEAELHEWKEKFGKSNQDRARKLVGMLTSAPELEARERSFVPLLDRMARASSAERRRRGLLGFGDLLRLAAVVLRDPALAREVRREVDVLLVDEFQDTSLIQRELVYRLRLEEGTKGPLSAARIRRAGLFLVGDRKQAIYGFRGADVAVFSRMCGELAGADAFEALGLAVTEEGPPVADFVALKESHRTGRDVTDFVNALSVRDFGQIAGADFEVGYSEADGLVPAVPRESRVYLSDPAPPVEGDASAPEPRLDVARRAASAVQFLMDAGGLTASSIAVLVRRRATIPWIAETLTQRGVPFVVAGLGVYETREVRDLAALLRLTVDPRDRSALAITLRGPLVGLSDATLTSLSTELGLDDRLLLPTHALRSPHPGADLPKDEIARLSAFRQRFQEARPAVLAMPADRAVRYLLSHFGIDRLLASMPSPRARLAHVDRIVTIAREERIDVPSFSRYLDRRIADEQDDAEPVARGEEDAVTILTIHASKGLDFEGVVVVDLDAAGGGSREPMGTLVDARAGTATLIVHHRGRDGEHDETTAYTRAVRDARARDAAERRRLTYVAITRAKKALVLVVPPGEPRSGSVLGPLFELRNSEEPPRFELLPSTPSRSRPEAQPIAKRTFEPLPKSRRLDRLVLPVTPLSVFRDCPRRFQLRSLLGFEEPLAVGDQLDLFSDRASNELTRGSLLEDESARAAGRAAHRVLERWESLGAPTSHAAVADALEREGLSGESAHSLAPDVARVIQSRYFQGLAGEGAALRREVGVVATFETLEETLAHGTPTRLVVRGTVDLWTKRASGAVEIIDYKLARPGPLTTWRFQLSVYALALSKSNPGSPIRAGVTFLRGDGEPQFIEDGGSGRPFSASDLTSIEKDLEHHMVQFARSRASDTWEGVPVDVCRRLACGFIGACHGDKRRR